VNEKLIESQSKLIKILRRLFLKRPLNVEEKDFPFFVVLNLVAISVTLNHVCWLLIFWVLGVNALALFNIISVSMWAFSIYLCRRGSQYFSYAVMAIEILLHQALCVIIIGWGAGFQYFILLIPIGLFMLPAGRDYYRLFFLLISFISFVLLDFIFRNAAPLFVLNPLTLNIINYSNIAFTIAITSVAVFYFALKMHETRDALLNEKSKVKEAYSLLSK